MESILHQKFQELWLKKGNKNSKFFHLSLAVRRRRNKILAVKDGREWINDKDEIKDYFIGKF